MSRDTDKQNFYCGTSNVVLPVPNKTHFPPEYQCKSRLCYYSSLFNTVEINSSFYKIPMRKTVEKWASEVEGDFLFTFKLWRGITHEKNLAFNSEDISRFMHAINGAGDKKGCLLIQFPASIKFSLFAKVRHLLQALYHVPDTATWKVAIEFRDRSWYNDTTYELLDAHDCAIVHHDMPAAATPSIDMDSSFCYYRFHGENGDYRGSYPEDVLADTALSIKYELDNDKPVFAYFNNTMGAAVANADELGIYVRS